MKIYKKYSAIIEWFLAIILILICSKIIFPGSFTPLKAHEQSEKSVYLQFQYLFIKQSGSVGSVYIEIFSLVAIPVQMNSRSQISVILAAYAEEQ